MPHILLPRRSPPGRRPKEPVKGLLLFFGCGGLLCGPFFSTAYADAGYREIIDSAGPHEENGSVIRTGKDGTVDIALDRSWENMIHLCENSQLDLLGYPARQVELQNGRLFALFEKESDPLTITAGHSRVKLSTGGFMLETGENGDGVKVFSEVIQFAHPGPDSVSDGFRELSEGWKQRVPAAGGIQDPERMDYEDYADWQKWFKQSYERRDNALVENNV